MWVGMNVGRRSVRGEVCVGWSGVCVGWSGVSVGWSGVSVGWSECEVE